MSSGEKEKEDELLRPVALEQKTIQLARSVAMMQATLESTFEGIIVTDDARRVTGFNDKYTITT